MQPVGRDQRSGIQGTFANGPVWSNTRINDDCLQPEPLRPEVIRPEVVLPDGVCQECDCPGRPWTAEEWNSVISAVCGAAIVFVTAVAVLSLLAFSR